MAPILLRNYNDTSPPTTLTANIGTTDTSIPVVSTVGYPTPPFTLGLDRGTVFQEVCLCDVISDATHFHVIRGYDGTTRVTHTSPTGTVEHCVTSLDYVEANQHHSDTTRDDHLQYMNANGARHDVTARHQVGTTIPVGTPAALALGQSAVIGATGSASDAGHKHAFPTVQSLVDAVIPVGTMWALAAQPQLLGGVPQGPPGWIICDGRAIPRATFPLLYAATGNGALYGAGNGTTTFNVPNTRICALVGAAPDYINTYIGAHYLLGSRQGEETHALNANEMPNHAHSIYDPQHSHNGSIGWFVMMYPPSTIGLAVDPADMAPGSRASSNPTTGWSASGIGIYAAGASYGHNNMPPYLAVWYIIKADTFVNGFG